MISKFRKLCILLAFLMFLSGCGADNRETSASTTQEPSISITTASTTVDIIAPLETAEATESQAPTNEITEASTGTLRSELEVHFIDVGQGDSIFIKAPSKNILIDGGPRSAGTTVVNYLKSCGIDKLDVVIGTHPHEDHIGGLIDVLQDITVAEVIDPAVVHTSKTFEDYLALIDQKDIVFTEGSAGMVYDLGTGATMGILHPTNPSPSQLNDTSIVVKITYGDMCFLLQGDAEQSSEAQILQRGYNLKSTVLKVGHHGSRTSTSPEFLKAVAPEVAIIMCGEGNSYGHPHEETLQKLSAARVNIYRTDIHGTIVIATNGQTYDVNVKAPYQYTPPKTPEPTPTPTPKATATPTPTSNIKPTPTPQPTTKQGEFVGSIKSDKYHYPSCRNAKNILPENEIWFDSVQEAKSKGYTPCGVCNPK